jgi:hypothetical protein
LGKSGPKWLRYGFPCDFFVAAVLWFLFSLPGSFVVYLLANAVLLLLLLLF